MEEGILGNFTMAEREGQLAILRGPCHVVAIHLDELVAREWSALVINDLPEKLEVTEDDSLGRFEEVFRWAESDSLPKPIEDTVQFVRLVLMTCAPHS